MDKFSFLIIVLLIGVGAVVYFALGGSFSKNSNLASLNNMSQDNSDQQAENDLNNEGIRVEILQQGTGDTAKAGDTVTVDYVGTLENGTKFDSSIDRGQPFLFTLGQNSVIQGWELGVLGMKVGEKRKLTIPPELAYGEDGAGDIIPPSATLIFEIDMLGVN